MDHTWEDFIALNNQEELGEEILPSVANYLDQRDGTVTWDEGVLSLADAVQRDPFPLPIEAHREGYYGPNHYNYWASGLRDWFQIKEWADKNGKVFQSTLDIGCASGRLIRHLHRQAGIQNVFGCDINRLHIDWIFKNLPNEQIIFQNTSIPSLPIDSGSLDLVTAFSVFTHIESFDTSWLSEIRRVLKPGGIAWLTVHGDRTWRELKPTWPIYSGLDTHPEYQSVRDTLELPKDRLVFRWNSGSSYSANIFYRYEYLRRTWGRFLEYVDLIPALPDFQDIVIMRKR